MAPRAAAGRAWLGWLAAAAMAACVLMASRLTGSQEQQAWRLPQLAQPAAAVARAQAAQPRGAGSQEQQPAWQLPQLLAQPAAAVARAQHPSCAFLASGAANVRNESVWGRHGLCDVATSQAFRQQLASVQANCFSCLTGEDVCSQPPLILFHMFLSRLHPTHWEGNLLSVKAWLMTQDLSRSKLILWAPSRDSVVNANTSAFFATWARHVEVRAFDYEAELPGSPFERDAFFGNHSLVRATMTHPATYSDVLRLLLLHNHGGAWLDNDVVLLRDVTHFLAVGYQFVPRFTNNHVLFFHRRSPAVARLLRLATRLPANAPAFERDIIQRVCRPVGYKPVVLKDYGHGDVYNACLLRLALKVNNSAADAPLLGRLFDLPIALFDNHWAGCRWIKNTTPINDSVWADYASSHLAMHTRYPKVREAPPGSPLARVLALLEAWWRACDHRGCLPRGGTPLLAFGGLEQPGQEGADGGRRQ